MSSFWVSGCKGSSGLFILVQFFLFNLQLQHDGIKLHVQIVGSFQFALVVLPDVQCVSVQRQLQKKKSIKMWIHRKTHLSALFVFLVFFLGQTWVLLCVVWSVPRPVCGDTCPQTWSFQSGASPRPSTPPEAAKTTQSPLAQSFWTFKNRGVDWFSFICHKILLCNYNRFFFELHLIFIFFFLIFGIFMYKDTFNISLKTFSPDFIQYCAFIWTISLSWSIKFTQEQQQEPSRCNLAFWTAQSGYKNCFTLVALGPVLAIGTANHNNS